MATTHLAAYLGNYFPSILSSENKFITRPAEGNKVAPSSERQRQFAQQSSHSNSHQAQPQNIIYPPVYPQFHCQYTSGAFGHGQIEETRREPSQLNRTYHLSTEMMDRFIQFEDFNNSNSMDEYASDVDAHMREMEKATLPDIARIDAIQTEITWKHRKCLVLWLIEVHADFDLCPETLFLAINLLDRVCSMRVIARSEFMLLGMACLWTAAKYEENHGRVPSAHTLAAIMPASQGYTAKSVAAMEQRILRDVGYDLGHACPERFLRMQCKEARVPAVAAAADPRVRALARMVLDLTLVHKRFRPLRPSVLATAALVLAESLFACRVWSTAEPLVARVMANLEECLVHAPQQILDKYRSGKFLKISVHVPRMLNDKAAFLVQLASTQPYPPPSSGLLTPPKDAKDSNSIRATAHNWNSSAKPGAANAVPHTQHAERMAHFPQPGSQPNNRQGAGHSGNPVHHQIYLPPPHVYTHPPPPVQAFHLPHQSQAQNKPSSYDQFCQHQVALAQQPHLVQQLQHMSRTVVESNFQQQFGAESCQMFARN
ncbi:hypothetical protein HDU83_009578 [Entophlyctis luteolus]|nr:hypothetical protein HDU83_009578 [Entophlyctis luteolus]